MDREAREGEGCSRLMESVVSAEEGDKGERCIVGAAACCHD